MTGWIIAGCAAAFLLFLWLLPIRISFLYRERPLCTVWIAFIPVRILTEEPTEKRKKDTGKKKKKKSSEKEPKDSDSPVRKLRDQIGKKNLPGFLKGVIRIVGRLIGRLGRHLVPERCELFVAVGGEDAAKIAETTGKLCAAVLPLWQQLKTLLRVRKSRVGIRPDFLASETRYYCRIRIRIRVGWILHSALCALCSLLLLFLRQRKNQNHRVNVSNHKEELSCRNTQLPE